MGRTVAICRAPLNMVRGGSPLRRALVLASLLVAVFATAAYAREPMLDAADFGRGTVARVRLPERICSGTHAYWADAATLTPA